MNAASDGSRRYRSVPRRAAAPGDCFLFEAGGGEDWLRLSGTAGRIWELLEYPASVAEIAAALAAEYDARPQVVEADVRAAIASFEAQGLAAPAPAAPDRARERYLWLLKRSLCNLLYVELELQVSFLLKGADGLTGHELQRYLRDIAEREPDRYRAYLAAKQEGTGPRRFMHTMIGLFRLHNIERCAERVFEDRIPGDFLEAGICRGGAAIFMRALQRAHEESGRRLWAVDSFRGVPPSVKEVDRSYGLEMDESHLPWLACDLATVRSNFARYDMLDANVEFLPGWLEETLPAAPIGPLALVHLDVDLYSATSDCLDLLYDKVSPGGFVMIDDYGLLACCRDAVDAFRARRRIEEPIQWVDGSGIFWRKAGGQGS